MYSNFGIIFDIDGVLTLPITPERKISIPDIELFEYINQLAHQDVYINFISGRSYYWFETFIANHLDVSKLNYNCFFEYGLVSYINGLKTISDTCSEFRTSFLQKILSLIGKEAQRRNTYFDEDKFFIKYPVHGSLWIEKKDGMLSVLSNTNIEVEDVWNLVEESISPFNHEIRFLKHHLGCDILPKEWSKEQGAIEVKKLAPNRVEKWFIFGDNESDKEMCKPFTNYEYFDTKNGASETTKLILKAKFPSLLEKFDF